MVFLGFRTLNNLLLVRHSVTPQKKREDKTDTFAYVDVDMGTEEYKSCGRPGVDGLYREAPIPRPVKPEVVEPKVLTDSNTNMPNNSLGSVPFSGASGGRGFLPVEEGNVEEEKKEKSEEQKKKEKMKSKEKRRLRLRRKEKRFRKPNERLLMTSSRQ